MFNIADELKKGWWNRFFKKSLMEFVVKLCLVIKHLSTYDAGSLIEWLQLYCICLQQKEQS